jgi:O-antigen ligase
MIASDRFLYATVVGLLGAMIYFRARNSEICLLVIALIGYGFVWRDRASGGPNMQRALQRLAVVFVALAAVAAFALAPRLKEFGETVAVAFDTETYRAWIAPTYDFPGAYPWPRLSDGAPVDQSLYQRAAWFKEGAMIAARHPLGLGFGRDVFGWALLAERDIGRATPSGVPQGIPINSHSAFLELAIGGGVPGVVLIVAALLLAMRIGYRAYRDADNPAGLMMVMLVADFSCRMMIDSNFRDHSLQMLMFAIGAFTAFAQDGAPAKSASGVMT